MSRVLLRPIRTRLLPVLVGALLLPTAGCGDGGGNDQAAEQAPDAAESAATEDGGGGDWTRADAPLPLNAEVATGPIKVLVSGDQILVGALDGVAAYDAQALDRVGTWGAIQGATGSGYGPVAATADTVFFDAADQRWAGAKQDGVVPENWHPPLPKSELVDASEYDLISSPGQSALLARHETGQVFAVDSAKKLTAAYTLTDPNGSATTKAFGVRGMTDSALYYGVRDADATPGFDSTWDHFYRRSLGDGTVEEINLAVGLPTRMSAAGDGAVVIAEDGTYYIPDDGQPRPLVSKAIPDGTDEYVAYAGGDGQRVVTVSSSGQVEVFDLSTGSPTSLTPDCDPYDPADDAPLDACLDGVPVVQGDRVVLVTSDGFYTFTAG